MHFKLGQRPQGFFRVEAIQMAVAVIVKDIKAAGDQAKSQKGHETAGQRLRAKELPGKKQRKENKGVLDPLLDAQQIEAELDGF